MKLYELMAQITRTLHNLTPEQAREVLEAEVRTGVEDPPDVAVADHVLVEKGITVMYQKRTGYVENTLYPSRDWACDDEECDESDLRKVVYFW